MDLAEFLLARIAEDEAAAREATPGPWRWDDQDLLSETSSWRSIYGQQLPTVVVANPHEAWWEEEIEAPDRAHIARWDPARVLAECEAKREVVRQFTMIELLDEWHPAGPAEGAYVKAQTILRLLAAVYREHPDYRAEWAPTVAV